MNLTDEIRCGITKELSDAIETYRMQRANGGHRMPRAAAVRELLKLGVEAYIPPRPACTDPHCLHTAKERPLHIASPCLTVEVEHDPRYYVP